MHAAATADIAPGLYVLNINGPDVVSWNEYIERLGDALGTLDRVTQNAALFRLMSVTAGVMRMGGKVSSIRSFYRRSNGTARAALTNVQALTKLYPTLSELNLLVAKYAIPQIELRGFFT